jgi:hypothetical protein
MQFDTEVGPGTNLLVETQLAIRNSGHTPGDIVFIGSEASGYCCTWERFQVLADREYDSGPGAMQVANDLVIVFSDGMKMWRNAYDGSEWWECEKPFRTPEADLKILDLFAPVRRSSGCPLHQCQPEGIHGGNCLEYGIPG